MSPIRRLAPSNINTEKHKIIIIFFNLIAQLALYKKTSIQEERKKLLLLCLDL